MPVAELELHLSRPVAPTRRIALGERNLPTDPAPGAGGILLGAIVGSFAPGLDQEFRLNLLALTRELEAGMRIAQPRLRHRLQTDRVGLTSHRHRLETRNGRLVAELDQRGRPEPHVIGAVYAAGLVTPMHRPEVFAAIRRGLTWRGEPGAALLGRVAGRGAGRRIFDAGDVEPRSWALAQLGLDGDADVAAVQRRFRELLRRAHPDHGGSSDEAATRIEILSRARSILLTDASG